jgi:hypothetical protein
VDPAFLRRQEHGVHAPQMGARRRNLAQALPHQGEAVDHQGLAGGGLHPVREADHGRVDPVHRRLRQRRRRAVGKLHVGRDDEPVHLAEHLEFEDPALHKTEGDHQHGDGRAEGDVPPVDRLSQKGSVNMGDDPFQSPSRQRVGGSQGPASARFPLPVRVGEVAQVRRQQNEALHQGNKETGDDHHRQDFDELAHDAADVGQGQEGHDGGDDRRDHRHAYLAHPLHGGPKGRLAVLAVDEDGLPHHDGVVHHDPQDHDEAEKGDHVDGLPHHPENHHAAAQGDGDAHAGPEAQPQVEEEPQQQKDQDQSDNPVFEQQVDAVLEHLRGVIDHVHLGPGRQLLLFSLDEPLHRRGDGQGVILPGLEDIDQHRRPAVDAGLDGVLGKAVVDDRQTVQGDHLPGARFPGDPPDG